jgi:tetratricopeptide (TPR) repeat protein
MGRYYSAIESYEMALSINSKFASAWYNKGNAYASLGVITRAIDSYKLAVQYNKRDVYALYNLANAYEQMGYYREAIDSFTGVIQLDSKHYESYFGRGNSFYQLEDYRQALKDYNYALALHSDNPELWYAKADAEYNLGKLRESLQSYRHVLKADPYNYNAQLDLCNTLIEAEEYAAASYEINRLMKSRPDWCEPYYVKAKLDFIEGRIEEGMRMIRIAFEVNPADKFEFDFEKDWQKILHFLISRCG